MERPRVLACAGSIPGRFPSSTKPSHHCYHYCPWGRKRAQGKLEILGSVVWSLLSEDGLQDISRMGRRLPRLVTYQSQNLQATLGDELIDELETYLVR